MSCDSEPIIMKTNPTLEPYKIKFEVRNNIQICIMTFPRGRTVLMAASDPKRPTAEGIAWVVEYTQYLANTRRYQPYSMITLTSTGHSFRTQMMERNTLENACEIICTGNYPCFINPNWAKIKQVEFMKQKNKEQSQYLDMLLRNYTQLDMATR